MAIQDEIPSTVEHTGSGRPAGPPPVPPIQPRPGPKSASTVPEWIRGMAEAYGDREAVVGGGTRLAYRQLEAESRLLARGLLARGVGKGARVGLWLGNSPAWVVLFAAIARCGAVAVPLSTFFSDAELAAVVRHADLCGIVVHPRFLEEDQRDRLASALPDLAHQGTGSIAIPAAPHLRWVLSFDHSADGPPWSADLDWLTGGAEHPGFDDELLANVETEIFPDDDAIMIYTSGSTAMPKGVPHSHRTIMDKTHYLREWMGVVDGVRSYIASPFFWVGGLTMSLLIVLDGGGTQYCTDRFRPGEVLALIESERIERVVLYPHHVKAILEHSDFACTDRSSLQEGDARLLPGDPTAGDPDALRIGLGMTETFGGYWWGRQDSVPVDPQLRSERRPPPFELGQPGVEIRVLDSAGESVGDGEIGEICLRGPSVTRGLHKVPRQAIIDTEGWFHTGDRARVDGHRLHFQGRFSDMIKTAGANVSPSEVVTALRQVEGVREAYVLGLSDPVRGQIVVAAVIAEDGRTFDADDLRRALRDDLSTFKVPSHIVFFGQEEIPWTPSHKVRLGRLAELLGERIGAVAGQGASGAAAPS
jgi:acyl-CoA synthetase (AMP-forming)/AMP-acid ligase II